MTRHDRNKRAGGHIFMGEAIRKPSNTEPCCCCGGESRAIVGLETPMRLNRDDLVAICELPGFRSLHEGLMVDEFLRCLGGTMRFDIVRARHQLSIDRPDASCDQVGVLEIANPDSTIETLCYEIDEAITVGGMDLEPRVPPRHVREHWSEVGWPESKRRSDSQTASKVTGGQDRFPGHVNFGADPIGVVSKRDPGFCERGAACCSYKKLDAKVRFKPEEPPTDDRLGDAEPPRGG